MANNTADFTTTVTLPSHGRLYDGRIPEKITLRPITVREEKLLNGSTDNPIDKVIKNCIVDPKDIEMGELLSDDEEFLLIKLRTHTYGSMYQMLGTCAKCGSVHSYDINLDEMQCKDLPADYTDPVEFTLPLCGKKISMSMLRMKDAQAIDEKADKIFEETGVPTAATKYVLNMSRRIKAIDGEKVDVEKAQFFVEGLYGRDSSYIDHMMATKIPSFGYNNFVTVKCKSCGSKVVIPFRIGSNFFRTIYTD